MIDKQSIRFIVYSLFCS